ncbi:RecQ family ATP-dependent DNA helicase [Xanthomonas campestris pv. raphani]|uniref:RecQ family ATP-dependent DNA helicase n=1 Tax=Xanthomonas campestris TaxID=339 RepID=UPI0027A31717|nr:RecQ family ATP-dependent DNA helicase [Xanthomonas campestris]MEA9709922.1 RecQ family ATP-dependent DNA helicase [Xanthomonas campestris]MEA9784064.1 RecQ family ATP-dependent DNA helicase [Xanthomonas campestris pv. raphani]MEA9792807.1 RecQ family ATP-dependent DNA helicase [Xanthomonas campestris pv. raphani]MEA9881241.1 RecQ family ATP-dependent DNA helicase [Xanthomonas campestris pv. raphani]WDI90351.1 RecQ family ATP-dependent DNA helicase [Xanthomonas campestris pv. raphani]
MRDQAEELLRCALQDASAHFRDGQWEAIDALVNRREKLLVVQRTGWGKSSVYFISTRILRDRGLGPTIIISPLLALMRNQIESARRLGIRAVTINSSNTQDWEQAKQDVLSGIVDCLLISPERLANDGFVEDVLQPIASSIGLMVVDEAHCISDWGQDFRPDYRRIVNVMRFLPANVPFLGTTATANDRVVNDIREQFGDIRIQRGTLVRESLALQNITLSDPATRLAWLAKALPELLGTGIIYTLTIRDAEQVAQWLQKNGIQAWAYYGDITHPEFPDSNAFRQVLEEALLNNTIKVLVSTSALGMGYDKPDLGFVIHYQSPGSVVDYYQQVGRAGRAIDRAIGILLSGTEDEKIHEFFRRSAFPTAAQVRYLLNVLERSDGLKDREIEQYSNMASSKISAILKFLSVENPAPIIKMQGRWRRTPVPYVLDEERIARLTAMREQEWGQMQAYIAKDGCLMAFLRDALDDPENERCGRCANCVGHMLVHGGARPDLLHQAAIFMRQAEFAIKPKKQTAAGGFPRYGFPTNLPEHLHASEGRVLSRWRDGALGELVADGKEAGQFTDDLVTAMAEMIGQRWRPVPAPEWLCCVPSLTRPNLVPDFARRLAEVIGIPFVDCVRKVVENGPQKHQQNRHHQCSNLDGVFDVLGDVPAGPVLLVDDMIDSGWTFAVIAALLRQKGSGLVRPVALAASTSKS